MVGEWMEQDTGSSRTHKNHTNNPLRTFLNSNSRVRVERPSRTKDLGHARQRFVPQE